MTFGSAWQKKTDPVTNVTQASFHRGSSRLWEAFWLKAQGKETGETGKNTQFKLQRKATEE